MDEQVIIRTDGEVMLLPNWLSVQKSDAYFSLLRDAIAWQQDKMVMFGKTVQLPRLTAWYGEAGVRYRYSGIVNESTGWIAPLAELAAQVGSVTKATYNGVLCNYYRDGADYMGWHSDDERELGELPTIAIVSLGDERQLAFRHKKTKEKKVIQLTHGSLLIMRGETQTHWLHTITKTKKPKQERMSLTFRCVVGK
jgi:alkylated DNA repair dioxygenase AlkB